MLEWTAEVQQGRKRTCDLRTFQHWQGGKGGSDKNPDFCDENVPKTLSKRCLEFLPVDLTYQLFSISQPTASLRSVLGARNFDHRGPLAWVLQRFPTYVFLVCYVLQKGAPSMKYTPVRCSELAKSIDGPKGPKNDPWVAQTSALTTLFPAPMLCRLEVLLGSVIGCTKDKTKNVAAPFMVLSSLKNVPMRGLNSISQKWPQRAQNSPCWASNSRHTWL